MKHRIGKIHRGVIIASASLNFAIASLPPRRGAQEVITIHFINEEENTDG